MEKILVVDDSKMNRAIAKVALEDQGYEVTEAQDGDEALEVIPKVKPDLILLDILMPKLNGLETCKIIKNDPNMKDIPVIFVTAIEEISSKKEGFEIGADDYITKPYILDELILRVGLILRMKRERDELRTRTQEILEESKNLTDSQSELIQKEKELLLRQIYVALHHEIRNPLTTILLGGQVLKTMVDEDNIAQKRVVSEIVTCAKRIRDIMDMLGKLKTVGLKDYVDGTLMVDLKKV